MTKDEAKTKWCPMVRAGHVAGMAVNISLEDRVRQAHMNCIADQCMMWRWASNPEYKVGKIAKDVLPSGYCGLAGINV